MDMTIDIAKFLKPGKDLVIDIDEIDYLDKRKS